VNNVAISSDAQWITTAGADGRVLVWYLAHEQSSRSLTGPSYLTKPPVATVFVRFSLRAVRFDPSEPHRLLTLAPWRAPG
jgi:hypothetical protein